ncbi:MAG TPA: ABC transporter permease [Thermoanaerobaculia bacterium]|jgi:predicted permease|nr:ABC transporter permease [Thermoanaerobaculia bacterium]
MPSLAPAVRQLLRRPPLGATLALAAGLAGSLVLLAVADAMLFHPLPGVARPERLFTISQPNLSYPSWRDFATAAEARGTGIVGVAGYSHRAFALEIEGEPVRLAGATVTGNYFPLLGARAGRGRLLGPIDDAPDAAPAVVLSPALWRSRFGGRTDVVGRAIRLNGVMFTVVGIAAPPFRGLARDRNPALWVSASAWIRSAPRSFGGLGLDTRSWSWLRAVGRLADDGTLARAAAVLGAEAKRQERAYPNDTRKDFQIELTPTERFAAGFGSARTADTAAGALAALVALLVALSVASAAHLFLARGEARRGELSTRLALGADRRALAALLLAEPIAAALAAAALALLAARGLLALLAERMLPGGVRLGDLGLAIDPRVAGAGFALALIAGLAAGWLPARRLLGTDLARTLATRALGDRTATRSRRGLAAAQVAVALVLVAATALAARALSRAAEVETGFDGERLGFATLDPGLARLPGEQVTALRGETLAVVRALPQVASASLVSMLPLDPDSNVETLEIEGYAPAPDEQVEAEIQLVGPGAFSTLGTRLVAGRELDERDRAGAERTVVVSRSFAAKYFAGKGAARRDPLGARLEMFTGTATIIGVAEDVRAHGLGEVQAPAVYLPFAQLAADQAPESFSVIYRARTSAAEALPAVHAALLAAAPSAPIAPEGTFADLYAATVAPQRLAAALFGLFGGIGTLLAASGLYGLVAFAAAARTREIGLRMALGARPSGILRLVSADAIRPVLLGTIGGLALAVPLALGARGVVYGLDGFDPVALLAAAALLFLTAGLAVIRPALLASKADPTAALRAE